MTVSNTFELRAGITRNDGQKDSQVELWFILFPTMVSLRRGGCHVCLFQQNQMHSQSSIYQFLNRNRSNYFSSLSHSRCKEKLSLSMCLRTEYDEQHAELSQTILIHHKFTTGNTLVCTQNHSKSLQQVVERFPWQVEARSQAMRDTSPQSESLNPSSPQWRQ